MVTLQPKTEPSSDRPSFLGLPASWRVWSNLGEQFWGGVLVGIGIGLLLGAVLVEQELMTLQRKAWVCVAGILLAGVGRIIATRAPHRGMPLVTEAEKVAARERFEHHFGEVNLGHATGVDNERIDADLARDYADNHEGGGHQIRKP